MKAGVLHHRRLTPLVKCAGLVLGLLTSLFSTASVRADGCFVAPPFVWNKHKDINEPTQKAIMVYDAGREDLILQVKYNGPVEQFGWLVPVPSLPTVQQGSMKSFYALSRYTQEHWEPREYGTRGKGEDNGMDTLSAGGAGEPEPVKVVEIKTVGAYEVAVLSATEPGSLEKWLAANGFAFPAEKADVIDSYVKQHWYFVAVKIDLRKTGGFRLVGAPRQATTKISGGGVAEKLGEGELQPLQISFASEQCVFPLKISSVNGTPSEVQVYVLSPEPLVERRMFEKKFPEIKKHALEQYANRVKSQQHLQEMRRSAMMRFNPEMAEMPMPPMETNVPLNQILQMYAPEEELLRYGAVTEKDVPDSKLPRFSGKTRWLTKQTWTFKPEEMEDLLFQPAVAVFAEDLDSEAGYYVAQNLARLGTNAVPALLTALQSTNASVRLHAVSVLNQNHADESLTRDPRVANYLPALFKAPEWEIRMAAAQAAGEAWNPQFAEPVIQLLRDENEVVQQTAVFALQRNQLGWAGHLPELQKMLKDEDLKVRAPAFELLSRMPEPIPREDVLPLLGVADPRVLNLALQVLERDGVSSDELLPLLHSTNMPARMAWLRAMRDFREKSAIPDIIFLLRDTDPQVQRQAWNLLKTFTGQEIPKDQPDQWEQWWAGNKIPVMIDDCTVTLAEDPTNGATYHDRGCLYYDSRAFTNALADFQKAGELGSDNRDYSHYRIWLIRARLGEKDAATRELASYLARRPQGKPWALNVGRFLAGQMTEVDFIAAAADPNGQTDREQHCEAWFYAGMKRLLAGDKTTAADYFQKCRATDVKSFEEYDSAGAELKFLAGTSN
jgi:HEAT repeat protein